MRRRTPGSALALRVVFGAAALLSSAPGLAGCAAPRAAVATPAAIPADDGASSVAAFTQAEDDALGWVAAADSRLAARVQVDAPDDVLKRIGMDAVVAEDVTAQIRGGSLDLFAFRARARALDEARRRVAAFAGRLPDAAPEGASITRPKLEQELAARMIDEERARTADESRLGEASGDLVRAMVALWTPPIEPQNVLDRDVWLQEHLLAIRDSLRDGRPRAGPMDLDAALYPLERLLLPLAYPKGASAIAEVRVALDADMRPVPSILVPERIALEARAHLGVALDVAALPARFARIEATLRDRATESLAASVTADASRAAIEARARALLFVETPCPTTPGTRVRSFAPPPERATICGALRALTEEPRPAAALVALHDDVVLAEAAVTTSPAPRTALLSHPDDDVVDALRKRSRERPVSAIALVLAAELLYGDSATSAAGAAGVVDGRLHAWRALGDAPLDVVARELGPAR